MTDTATQDRDAAKAKHDALTQLEVTKSLRLYHREWFAKVRAEVLEGGKPVRHRQRQLAARGVRGARPAVHHRRLVLRPCRRAPPVLAYYSDFLTKQGYHDGLSRYASLTLAVLLDEDNPDKPWGGVPHAFHGRQLDERAQRAGHGRLHRCDPHRA